MASHVSGWLRGRVFYLANSGVVASHRRRGIYQSLPDVIRQLAVAGDAVALRSRHSVLNNPMLIAKLRAGFHVSGLSQSVQIGMLVELTLHLSEARHQRYLDRACRMSRLAPDLLSAAERCGTQS